MAVTVEFPTGPGVFSVGFRIRMLSNAQPKGVCVCWGGGLYILPNFDKNRGRNTFSSFLLKYRGSKLYKFYRDLKKGGRHGGAYVVTFIEWLPSPGPQDCVNMLITGISILLVSKVGGACIFSLGVNYLLSSSVRFRICFRWLDNVIQTADDISWPSGHTT